MREAKCSEPSSAISTRPERQWNAASPPCASSADRTAPNSGSKCDAGVPSSICRIWLSLGIAVIANSVSQFDRPRARARSR